MKLLVFAIALVLCIGIMGCVTGGETTTDKDTGDEGTETGTTGGNTGTTGGSSEGSTGGNGNTGDVDTGTTDGNGDSGNVDTGGTGGQTEEKDFWSYFTSDVGYKVEYTVTSTGSGTATMTMYVSGEKSRTDTSAQGMEARTYLLDGEMYVCSQTEESWMCLSMGSAPATSADELEANQADYTPIPMPDKTIAGVTGHCYKLDDVNGYNIEYCFSDEGAILWTKTVGEGMTTEMTATSYSTAVTDADFVLPAEVTEMPSYG